MRARTPVAFALAIILLGAAEPLSAQPAQATLTASARVIDASAGTAAARAAESFLDGAESGGEAIAAAGLVRITVVEDGGRGARVVEIAFVGN